MYTLTTLDPELLLHTIYNTTYDFAILTLDLDGRITSLNAGAERITGFRLHELLGRESAVIFTPEDLARDVPREELTVAMAKGRAEDYRWHLRKDRSRFWVDGVVTPLRDCGGAAVGYLKIFRDLTERKLAEAEIQRVAHTDLLTGLPNRHAFEMRAQDVIAMTLRGTQPTALYLVDLDNFKQVNDSLGHQAGDALLREAAGRMAQVLRESDTLARLGGNEFVILQPAMTSLQRGSELAERLLRQLARPFAIGGKDLAVSASIGIAVCPQDAGDLEHLLKKADLAMYHAKEDGKGGYRYFTAELNALAHRKTAEMAAVRQAVAHHQFWLAYHPKVSAQTGEVVAFEALMRCSHPLLAGYSIERLVAVMTEAGLMKPFSLWVLRQACAQVHAWRAAFGQALKMCINLCSDDLVDPLVPGQIAAVLAEMHLPGSALEIELTERQALDVELRGISVLLDLRERGIGVSIDDFGTGYSALSYLRNLPVNAVKLDKSFLAGVPEDAQACSVVKAVMDLSRALDLDVVAEGVENAEQASFLRQHACNTLQGYLICPPLAAEEITAWLVQRAGPSVVA